ncbi:hypothetical protein MMC26_006477 [Xylographa opegraphella]|nr:hypothetical protein [Xylographa opegraphella]
MRTQRLAFWPLLSPAVLPLTSRCFHSSLTKSGISLAILSRENRDCFFTEQSGVRERHIRQQDVHVLKEVTKQTHLKESVDLISCNRGQDAATLDRLRTLSPEVAAKFSIKADTVDDLIMRLYSQCHDDQPISSYVALSYCWKVNSRRSVPWEIAENIAGKELGCRLPIHSSLFQALLSERESESEGVWCDQFCIDQSNEVEKRVAIGLMNIIYKEARCVIVALDDIVIDVGEEEYLRRYIKTYDGLKLNDETRRLPRLRETPPHIDSLRALVRFHDKILGAKYFTRAWCAHEMRMGKRHAFLVQCTHVEGRPDRVFRFDGSFLMHMICLAVEFPDHQDIASVRVNLRKVMSIVDAIMKRGQTNNHLDAFTQVFMLDAGGNPKLPPDKRIIDANREKLAIVLNSVGTGLTVKARSFDGYDEPMATHNECFRVISLLALAANNPAVLCTSGSPFRPDHSASAKSWLRWPAIYDEDNMYIRGRSMIDSSRISVDVGPNSETVQLDCLILGQSHHFYGPSNHYISKAQHLLSGCKDHQIGDRHGRFYHWRQLISLDTKTKYLFTLIVACMMQCGISWILNSMKRCGTSFAFHQTVDILLSERDNASKDTFVHSFAWIVEDKAQLDLIMKFGYYIFEKCLYRPWESQQILSSVPRMTSSAAGGPYLIFLPFDRPTRVVIPTALLADEYADLPRAWLLSQSVVDGVPQLELQGRSRAFGSSFSNRTATHPVKHLKIYGPS